VTPVRRQAAQAAVNGDYLAAGTDAEENSGRGHAELTVDVRYTAAVLSAQPHTRRPIDRRASLSESGSTDTPRRCSSFCFVED